MELKDKKEKLYASFIDESSLRWTSRTKKIKKILGTHQGRKLLDIGCGDGSFTEELRECVGELYGVDIAPNAIQLARERNIKAYQLDVDKEHLPFHDNYFDAIFCGEVIEHVFDVDHLLQEIHRVLKKGGIGIITTPNLASYPNRLALLLGFQPYLTGTGFTYGTGKLFSQSACPHLQLFTYRALKELLPLFGFTIKHSWGEGFPSIPKFLAPLDKLLSKSPSLAVQLVFVVEKNN